MSHQIGLTGSLSRDSNVGSQTKPKQGRKSPEREHRNKSISHSTESNYESEYLLNLKQLSGSQKAVK